MEANRIEWVLPSAAELVRKYSNVQVTISKPTEIACFSVDENRTVHPDRSQLKIYKPRDDFLFCADLRRGLDRFVKKPDQLQERLDPLLETMSTVQPFDWSAVEVVTWRGVLTKIFTSAWSRTDDDLWSLHGQLHHGRIYLIEAKEGKKVTTNSKLQEFIFGGFKFEALCMVSLNHNPAADDMEKRHAEVVNSNCEFDIVFRIRLGNHRLLAGAEVDGLDEDGCNYLELKTTREITDAKSRLDFDNGKLLKWWTQSFLAGIPNILVGYRDHQMKIVRLEKISVSSIPARVRGKVSWDPNAILAFGDEFFTWLKATLSQTRQPPAAAGDNQDLLFTIRLERYGKDRIISLQVGSDFQVIPMTM